MSQLSIGLLGPLQVTLDSVPIEVETRKALALLAYLAVSGEGQSRDLLATLFWPESDRSQGRNALRRTLSPLNKALGPDWLTANRERVRLNREAGRLALDVDQFESLIKSWRAHKHGLGQSCTRCMLALDEAVALYRDDFMAGFSLVDSPEFDNWQSYQREHLRRTLGEALAWLVQAHAARRDYARAIAYAQRWLAQDPLNEPVHRQLMCLYVWSGDRAAALQQYKACVQVLDNELGVPPMEETQSLHRAIIQNQPPAPPEAIEEPAAPAGPPAPQAAEPMHVHNLPAQGSPFVGRAQDVPAVLEQLKQSTCRLLTITGAGGMGKTRLSIAVAAEAAAHFADGVCYVPLAEIQEPAAIPSAIAAQLNLVNSGGADVRGQLYQYLHSKAMLLVLDNMEHLIAPPQDTSEDGMRFLSDLLQQAPKLTILVTSQERLNLVEEWIYPLEGLSYPEVEAIEAGETYEALALFAQCARKSQPDFNPEVERAAIVSICRRVEGMPLAIELAAGWIRSMSCAAIANELARSPDLLTTPLRNVPARHRSLRALFAHSWALLSPQERTLLRQLSVFQGGFTYAAAEKVAGATPRLLASLVDRSFIRRQPSGRFDMHGLLHQFIAEMLAEEPDQEALTRACHATFYADLVVRAGWELEPGDPDVETALNNESANVLAAWHWAVAQNDPAVVRKIMKWLVDYFRRRGEYHAGYEAFAEAVKATRRYQDKHEGDLSGLVGSLLLRQAKCMTSANNEEAYNLMVECVPLLRQAVPPEPLELAQALVSLGMTYARQGCNEEGESALHESIALFRVSDSALGLGAALRDFGQIAMISGRPLLGQQRMEESARLLATHDQTSSMQSTFILGTIVMMRGHYRQSEALMQRALRFFEEHHETQLVGYVHRNLGDLYTATGDFEQAKEMFAKATAYFASVRREWEVAAALCLSPAVLARLCGDQDAERQLTENLMTMRRIGSGQYIARSLHHLSRLRYDQGDYASVLALLDEALPIARRVDFRYATALILTQYGHTFQALQQTDSAHRAYAEALQVAGDEGIDRIAVEALCGVAELFAQAGASADAIRLWHLAHEHSAGEYETKRRAESRLREMVPNMDGDTKKEKRAAGLLNLEAAIAYALAWLHE